MASPQLIGLVTDSKTSHLFDLKFHDVVMANVPILTGKSEISVIICELKQTELTKIKSASSHPLMSISTFSYCIFGKFIDVSQIFN